MANAPFYMLLVPDEDGNPIRLLTPDKLKEFLADPEAYAGVRTFKSAAALGAEPDPNYWSDGTGILLRCEAVVPEPAGAYVLPS